VQFILGQNFHFIVSVVLSYFYPIIAFSSIGRAKKVWWSQYLEVFIWPV